MSLNPDSFDEEAKMSETVLRRNWRGATPLWRVYWIYGVVGSAILTALIVAPALLRWYTATTVIIALAIGFAYTVWIVVSIWRCAFNIEHDPLGIPRDALAVLARWLTVAWAINVLGLSALLFYGVIG
jgi:hypothetical protein